MRENYHTGKTLSELEWIEVLRDKEVTNSKNISILQIMYSFEDHKTSASQIGLFLGYNGTNTSSPVNLEMGNWGKRLVKKYPIRFSRREDGTERKWDVFFDGYQDSNTFIWKLKSELVKALEQIELTGQELYPEELPKEIQNLYEGLKKTIIVNSYERNIEARKKCIDHWSPICSVCEFDFEKNYGELGKGFIHVHHLVPVSDISRIYQVNPIKDLRPVCPNCHSMLHKRNPPLTIEELKSILNSNALQG